MRGYLSGSAWKEYQQTGTLAGEPLAAGLRRERPARSAGLFARDQGGDRPRREHHRSAACGGARRDAADAARATRASRVYQRGRDHRRGAGNHHRRHQVRVRRATATAKLLLIDEVLTPDSSRFWPADRYQPGGRSRASTSSRCATTSGRLKTAGRWNGDAPPPPLPAEVVDATSAALSRRLPATHRTDLGDDT